MQDETPKQLSPETVAELDFLPASYRQKIHKRQKQIWRRGILGVFLLLIIIGSLQQQRTHQQLQLQLETLQSQVKSLMGPLDDPQQVQADIGDLDRQCNLVSHLKMRVATTRLLEAISLQRPQFVSLSDIHLEYETAVQPLKSNKTNSGKQSKQPEDQAANDPFVIDLKQLRVERQTQNLIVVVSGLAPNHLAVSQYMAALQEVGHFKQLWLVSNEPYIFAEQKLRSFTVRLHVRRPGNVPTPAPQNDSGLDAGRSVADNASVLQFQN